MHLDLRLLIVLDVNLMDLLHRVLLELCLVGLLRILLDVNMFNSLRLLHLLGQDVSANRTPVVSTQPLLYTHSVESMTTR